VYLMICMSIFDFPTEVLEEGRIKFLAPELGAFKLSRCEYAPSKAPVFYNPVMELNRDLAVLALRAFQKVVKRELTVCEPLAGCGVRGIRFAKEVHGIQKVVLNDINPIAAKLAQHNVELNQMSHRVQVLNEDANLLLSKYARPRRRFDYVDIDPFGAPVGYVDSALRALRDEGLIALTATDMAPLCGVYPQVSLRKYGGRSLRTEYCHEIGVRLLAGYLASTAARQNISARPIFSHSADHYVRLYALCDYGAEKADETIGNMGYLLHCFNCLHRESYEESMPSFPRQCAQCGSRLKSAGPLWLGKIFDTEFCSSMKNDIANRQLRNEKKVSGLLSLIEEESDSPVTYYVISKICDEFDLPVPSLRHVTSQIKRSGFEVSLTHFNRMGFRTTAPASVVTEIVKKASKQDAARSR